MDTRMALNIKKFHDKSMNDDESADFVYVLSINDCGTFFFQI